MRQLVCMVAALALLACGEASDAPELAERVEISDAVVGKFERSCILCHVNGEGGAPRIGYLAEWQSRLQQGSEVLLNHTIEGFNSMPPLGYCMACERADFQAMIQLMTEAN